MARTHAEVASEIRRRIQEGEYPAGSPLPPERTLGVDLGVHRATLRRALSKLESEGLIQRSPGERPYPVPHRAPLRGSIGLFAADEDDPYARSYVAKGISAFLRDRQSPLQLSWTDNHTFRPDEADQPSLSQLVGLLVWPPGLTDVQRLLVARERMPVVVIDRRVAGFESDFVGFDDVRGGYEAAEHLYSLGHRRIAFVGPLDVESALARRHGFRRFCRDAGIAPVTGFESLARIDVMPHQVREAYLSLSKEVRPTAIICENDETAAKIMPFLGSFGIKVPDDLAIVGFGGAQPVLLQALGLTTFEQPFFEVGREAAKLLLSRLEGDHALETRERRLRMKLVVRHSTAGHSQA